MKNQRRIPWGTRLYHVWFSKKMSYAMLVCAFLALIAAFLLSNLWCLLAMVVLLIMTEWTYRKSGGIGG